MHVSAAHLFALRTHATFAVHTLGADDQLLHYEQSSLFPKMRKFTVPREALGTSAELQSRSDLEAVGAVICSSEASFPIAPRRGVRS